MGKPAMRKKDKLVTDKEWIEGVLREGQVISIALAALDGEPYALPMGYGYEDGAIYIHGAAKGYKNDLAAQNPKVSFNVTVGIELVSDERGRNFTQRYRSVTGFGEIHEITDLAEKNRALAILMRQYNGPHEDITEEYSKVVWVARIDIREVTGKVSGYPKP
ncbi:MAG: pyridoxamine 5'-phosphate oxidase family protein [Synergistaceae bacterium]|jgi:nitroimidazol reductase NimA-like FMN-containing flavoprotein (pyridoxamine 5'-phosphate oxidase superfamily)|nr:pyridoxamine 5'-phosphate oxidase family protein [Synergistaceae bacterium]